MRADAALMLARPAARTPRVMQPGQTMALLVLMGLMPLFMQFFTYLPDIRALWILAKLSPMLLLPLHVIGLFALRLPYIPLYVLIFLYALLVAPVLSILHLQNDFLEAMGATVKALTFAFYFGAAAAFTLLGATEATLKRAMLLLALANFSALWGLWVFLPLEAFAWDGAGTGMLFNDEIRGPRIMMPLAFGLTGLFWLARRFSDRPAVWPVLLIALGLTLMVTIFKQRTAIAATALILLFGMTAGWRQRAPLSFWATVMGGAGLAASLFLAVTAGGAGNLGGSLRDSLGGSLSVRETAAGLLMEFISQDPTRWLFGIGAATDYAEINFFHIMRYTHFFLSDLGWLGVVGEYGVLGTVLIVLAYLAGLRETHRAAQANPTPFRYALRDLVTYLLLVSPIYSTSAAPGQIATITAMAVILQRRSAKEAAAG
ncbi:hypothetical protein EJV46_03760 [Roseococcus sp. SYP-B2431]|uniref:hypothetical protein n=1 Tax=Roseococcus sp. SYP-B2431 TaxID=2496640 RepID=UPI00103EF6A4|nr:hypothetical protein [Roseococcus sp. SYP-B2431]TCH99797.1 hypothetical protein EJV46_03760 [Roseococcus sp. SYP-B2431]